MSIYKSVSMLLLIISCKCCHLKFGHLAQSTNKGEYNGGGVQTINALETAISDFNAGTMSEAATLFPNLIANNCTLSMILLETDSTSKLTLTSGLNMSSNFQDLGFTIPIIFGMIYSSLSMLLSPMLEAFDLLHISGSATSTFLTEYPSFYRSIADDGMQALGQIKLCNHFGWDQVGVVHMSSSYGTSLARSVTKWGEVYNISVQAFSYIEDDDITVIEAAQSMKESGLYIFILVIYVNDFNLLTQQLAGYNMHSFPYYYLATDSLWYLSIYHSNSLLNASYDGIIGTCRWSVYNTTSLDNLPYSYPLNVSISKYSDLRDRFPLIASDNVTIATYGYDNVLAVLSATDKYIALHGYYLDNINQHINNISMSNFSQRYADILKSEVSFIGLSGNVSFDNNGDRVSGLFSYCNYAKNKISKIGYFEPPNSIVLNENDISWPAEFILNNIIPPRSDYMTNDPNAVSDAGYSSLQIALYGLGGMVSLIILIYIIWIIVKFCKKFIKQQDDMKTNGEDLNDESKKLLNQEKRRLFISLSSDAISTMIGLADYVTDILSLITIISANSVYTNTFIILYFAISVLSSFVFTAHLTITIRNMFSCYIQLKSGMINGIEKLMPTNNEDSEWDSDEDSVLRTPRTKRKLSVLSSTHRQISFRMSILAKVVRQEAALIFVALCEDLPFFILNFYGLIHEKVVFLLLLSFAFNGMSLGYKICVTKGFFNNLQELSYLKDNIQNITIHRQNTIASTSRIVPIILTRDEE